MAQGQHRNFSISLHSIDCIRVWKQDLGELLTAGTSEIGCNHLFSRIYGSAMYEFVQEEGFFIVGQFKTDQADYPKCSKDNLSPSTMTKSAVSVSLSRFIRIVTSS